MINEINIVSYLYTADPDQSEVMMIDGHYEVPLATDYFDEFPHFILESIRNNLTILSTTSIYHEDEIGRGSQSVLSTHQGDITITLVLASRPAEFKQIDKYRDKFPGRTWYLSHVDVNGHRCEDWLEAETYVGDITKP